MCALATACSVAERCALLNMCTAEDAAAATRSEPSHLRFGATEKRQCAFDVAALQFERGHKATSAYGTALLPATSHVSTLCRACAQTSMHRRATAAEL